jgi:hypothetical protein
MENNILQYLQPRTQSLLARIFNMAGKAGETLVNAGHVTSTLRNCYFSDREGGGGGGGGGGGVNARGETRRPTVSFSEILQSSL